MHEICNCTHDHKIRCHLSYRILANWSVPVEELVSQQYQKYRADRPNKTISSKHGSGWLEKINWSNRTRLDWIWIDQSKMWSKKILQNRFWSVACALLLGTAHTGGPVWISRHSGVNWLESRWNSTVEALYPLVTSILINQIGPQRFKWRSRTGSVGFSSRT